MLRLMVVGREFYDSGVFRGGVGGGSGSSVCGVVG